MEINKTNYILLKIATVVAFVYGLIYCFSIVGLIIGVPIIMGAFYINSLIEMPREILDSQKTNVWLWSVFMLITINPISPILFLIAYYRMLEETKIKEGVTLDSDVVTEQPAEETPEQKRKKLELLKEQGLLTEEEFNKLTEEIKPEEKK